VAGIAVVWAAATVLFFLIRASGNPAAILIDPSATEQQYADLLRFYGLDRPIWDQYAVFLGQLIRADLGTSLVYDRPTVDLILERFPSTVELAAAALLIAIAVAVPLGVLTAVRRGGWADRGASIFGVIGQAMPNYWLGIILILIFAVGLRLLPTSGHGGVQYLILPALTLAIAFAAKYLRLTRSEMQSVLRQDYVRTAHSKGVRERDVNVRHSLRNAAIPVVTIVGTDIAALLGGAIIVETVFAWPGIGSLLMQGVTHRDYPLVQATVIMVTVIVVITSLLVDLVYAVLDPRIRIA
jgi:peptide/nickel transport system permease protein